MIIIVTGSHMVGVEVKKGLQRSNQAFHQDCILPYRLEAHRDSRSVCIAYAHDTEYEHTGKTHTLQRR